MFLSHRFGSLDTLARARYWLIRHGFEVTSTESESHDVSRLSLKVDFSQMSAALALIDSIEQSDPEGWPGFLTPSKTIHARGDQGAHHLWDDAHGPSRSPIHWVKAEDSPPADPAIRKTTEYLLSRWE
jgi:hypothetical protein